MYTIGQFSRICMVSAKALRHYERIGLLRPAKVDQNNQYRYYSSEQIALVKTITFMKELGIPLQTIKRMIQKGSDPEAVAAVLDEHRLILLEELNKCNTRLANLARWRNSMEANDLEDKKQYEIRMIDIPETLVYSARKILTNFHQTLPELLRSLLKDIEEAGGVCAGAPIILYYDEEFEMDKVDVEAAWPVADPALSNRTLPAVRAASYMYVGPYEGLTEPYEAIYAWINANGYQALTPMREVSINDPADTPPDKLVTHIQIPIKML